MSKLCVGSMVLSICSTNCYIIYHEGDNRVIVVDPADHGDRIYAALQQKGFKVQAVLLTHGHFDHIWGCKKLLDALNASGEEPKVLMYACEKEKALLGDAGMNVSEQAGRACTVDADVYLKDGETKTIADMTFRVIWTPGHTEGSCCFYFEEDGVLITGDTLFAESVGRTDFPTGSSAKLGQSIKEKLFVLPEETKCFPGHGPQTTIGYEKENNPFIY